MSNDLPTRLRALADMHYPAKLTVVLREAADALEAEETRRMMLNTSNGEWSKRFHAAEAEAAAMREAATDLLKYIKGVQGGDWSDSEKALSQPGPGASYQARMRKLERVLEIANQLGCRITAEGGHGLPVHALVLDLAEAVAPLKEKP